ncbi:hypothetical protein MLD38_022371 [Melastoma candidum]|uniref:Uncharacterized protein n=1 Tax=Melastoma candidum TaxID=119954 RepID=A0ACB9QME9_9MYRT|nr:hypothetical protein MLD38_022371 [Melastoma candidum]
MASPVPTTSSRAQFAVVLILALAVVVNSLRPVSLINDEVVGEYRFAGPCKTKQDCVKPCSNLGLPPC